MKERTSAQAYPLDWPDGWKRTKPENQRPSPFGGSYMQRKNLTVYSAAQDVLRELGRLGARLPVISSNLRVKGDGVPYSGQRNPYDAGVAVYFRLAGEPRVLACDRWALVQENMRAIAKHIEALRGMERWGVGSIEQAFRGFTGLPETAGRARPWRAVLGFAPEDSPVIEDVKVFYKRAALSLHPDMPGGSHEEMAELNAARDAALTELGDDG